MMLQGDGANRFGTDHSKQDLAAATDDFSLWVRQNDAINVLDVEVPFKPFVIQTLECLGQAWLEIDDFQAG
jgi:hypothetical protein